MNPAWQRAIAAIESRGSGDYAALGPVTRTGDRAYGRYQVMGNNIGPWTEAHLGRRMTPQEYLADQEAQDKVFNGQFGSYVKQTGNADDAASMWFTGKPLAEGANREDQLGTSGLAYVNKFRNAMGQSEGVQAIDRQMAPKPQQAQGMQTVMPAAQEESEGGYDWPGALQGAGASLMAIDNPRGGSVAAQLASDGRRAKKAVTYQTKYNEDTGTFFRIGSDGSVQSMRDPNHAAKAAKDTAMKDKDLAGLDEHVTNYDYLASSSKEAAQILHNLETGVLDLGFINNLKSQGKALTGMSDAQSRAYSQFEQFITRQVNEDLRLNKGVQTEGDAFRSLKQMAAGGMKYDNETAKEAFGRLINRSEEANERGKMRIESLRGKYGADNAELSPYYKRIEGWDSSYADIKKQRDEREAARKAPAPSTSKPMFKLLSVD